MVCLPRLVRADHLLYLTDMEPTGHGAGYLCKLSTCRAQTRSAARRDPTSEELRAASLKAAEPPRCWQAVCGACPWASWLLQGGGGIAGKLAALGAACVAWQQAAWQGRAWHLPGPDAPGRRSCLGSAESSL